MLQLILSVNNFNFASTAMNPFQHKQVRKCTTVGRNHFGLSRTHSIKYLLISWTNIYVCATFHSLASVDRSYLHLFTHEARTNLRAPLPPGYDEVICTSSPMLMLLWSHANSSTSIFWKTNVTDWIPVPLTMNRFRCLRGGNHHGIDHRHLQIDPGSFFFALFICCSPWS